MRNMMPSKNHEIRKTRVLYAAAQMFLEHGYTATSLREIAKAADINIGSLVNLFHNKEDILVDIVKYTLEGQFAVTEELLKGKTEDKLLIYATETTLQLHMAESGEHLRNLYNAAYSMPKTMEIIQRTITRKLEEIFKDSLPHLETKDFFELEIASGGIMRSFMTVPCDMYFTMERKVRRFLETTFKLYDVPQERIQEAIDFVAQFDFKSLAQQSVERILSLLSQELA